MVFYVDNEVNASFDFDIEEIAKKVSQAVLDSEGCTHEVEISLIITDDEGIHEMNRDFRGIDRPTDVLSFPNVSYDEPGDFSVIDGEQNVDLLNPDTGNIIWRYCHK
jgi:probable rRNA maturation factor